MKNLGIICLVIVACVIYIVERLVKRLDKINENLSNTSEHLAHISTYSECIYNNIRHIDIYGLRLDK